MNKLEIGQTVYGRICGIFEIDSLDVVCDIEGAFLKELNPSTGERGPHPAMFMPLSGFSTKKPLKAEDINPADILDAIRPFVEAKKYNPNNGVVPIHNKRTMSIRGTDIAVLTALFVKLGGEL